MGKRIRKAIIEQRRDAKSMQDEYEYVDHDDDEEEEHKYDRDENDSSMQTESSLQNLKPLTIQITNSNGDVRKSKKGIAKAERMSKMLEQESIDRLLTLELPMEVTQCLGSPSDFKLPSAEEKENEILQRDLRKISHGL